MLGIRMLVSAQIWLADPGPEEVPGLLGGLSCFGGAEHDGVDVGQVFADVQG